MKKTAVFGAVLLFGIAGAAEIDLNSDQIWMHPNVSAGKNGAALEIVKPGMIKSTQMIPVNDNTTYQFSGEVRKTSGAPSALFLAGFILFDKDKKEINPADVRIIPGTDTELAADVNPGDTSVKIKNGIRWAAKPGYFAAFNATTIPNRDLSPSPVTSVKREGGVWTVAFSKPLQKAYKANSRIRIQATGAFFSNAAVIPKDEWTAFRISVKGVSEKFENKYLKFWPGTAYVSPMIMANWNWGSPERNLLKSEIRNFKLEIFEPGK